MERGMEEFEYDEDGVNDFYWGFESLLDNDEITSEEAGFMVGFTRADD